MEIELLEKDEFIPSTITIKASFNNEIVRLDALICHALGVKPDTRRMSAADGKEDARRD